jgi:hypothetical protein
MRLNLYPYLTDQYLIKQQSYLAGRSLILSNLAIHIKGLNKGVKVRNGKISFLLYADNIVLLVQNERDLQYMLNAMYEWAM